MLVSNVLQSGPSRAIVGKAGTVFQLILSSSITTEVDDVLQRPRIMHKFPLTAAQRKAYLDTTDGRQRPRRLIEVTEFTADPKDTHLLACSLEGQADYLVTGDTELLNLGSFHGTKIVTPRAFLAIIES